LTGFTYIEPEVAGSIGGKSRLDHSVQPPRLLRLEYQFSGWLGGDLVKGFRCYAVTRRLREAIDAAQLSGITFHEMIVSVDRQFHMLHPGVKLPPFDWMKVHGVAGQEDFGIAQDLRLVVSRDAGLQLRGFNLSDATFEEYP